MNIEASPRAQILTFLILTLVFSIIFYVIIIRHAGTVNTPWTLALMWVPGFVGMSCAYVFNHQNPKEEVGLQARPRAPYLILAYAVPAMAAILILTVSLILGIGEFQFLWDKTTMNRLLFAPIFGVLAGGIFCLGEELGWRGYLHSRLSEIDFEQPYLVTGIIWAAWHWPLILFAGYTNSKFPLIGVGLFTISVVSFSIFLGQLREASGSIWPAVLAHAVHNTWIQIIYPHFIRAGALDPLFGGESGLILAILYLSFAIFLQKRPID